MMSDVIAAVTQMQRQQLLKDCTTQELLNELLSREAIKLRHEGEKAILDVNTAWGGIMNRARERPPEVLFLCRKLRKDL